MLRGKQDCYSIYYFMLNFLPPSTHPVTAKPMVDVEVPALPEPPLRKKAAGVS